MDSDRYFEYYQAQARGIGGGFKGARSQKGSGLGSFLSGIFKKVFPYLKQGARALGSELLDTGTNLLRSKLNNEDMSTSIDKHLGAAGRNLGAKAASSVQAMLGMGYKKRRSSTRTQSRASKRPRKKAQPKKKRPVKKKTQSFIKKRRDIFN
jgi:hypothetical protein